MKVCVLGAGTWGMALTYLLARNGHQVSCWGRNSDQIAELKSKGNHPKLPPCNWKGVTDPQIHYTTELEEAIQDASIIVEAVTAQGLPKLLQRIHPLIRSNTPFVVTSKGIEQETGLILPEVALRELGESMRPSIGVVSGPGYASEIVRGLPASVVCSAYSEGTMRTISELFTQRNFRVYPNADLIGVSLGGALKNVVAIACGISQGLGFGHGALAALLTRGLHEMRKLALAMGGQSETLNGLAGMGDFFLTCSSPLSRNYRFGHLIAQGHTIETAKQEIGMVVEGIYTCLSTLQQAKKLGVNVPITENVDAILHGEISPSDAVARLMMRTVKDEHL